MIVVIALCAAIIKVLVSIDFRTVFLAAGEDLLKDEKGHTNFLIMGTGGAYHDGPDLTDTIIVTSIDQEKETVSMVSIPRDFYVENEIPSIPDTKINEIYYYAKKHFNNPQKGLEYLKGKIEELADLKIQYYIKVDFTGFEKIIDALGGIDINVPESIYDPYFPKEGTIYYETFSIKKGPQHMDGETALKYARSRKTSSDFDRSQRQQSIIYAIKEKALQIGTIFNKDKINELLSILKDNIETNLSVREFLTLGAIADRYPKDKIITKLIHDDPTQCGGFLYTPPKELYNNVFILIPAGGEKYVHLYFDLITQNPLAFQENLNIQILNGTKSGGVAAETKQVLKRYCLNVSRFGNARSQEIPTTTIYYKMIPLPKENPEDETKYYRPHTIDLLKQLIPQAQESTIIPQKYIELGYDKESDVIIELGNDYVNSENYLEDAFYPLYSTIFAPITSETTSADLKSEASATEP
jgi:LCP family protein required for cell wall assembly